MKSWIIDLESFRVEADTEEEARTKALEYLDFRPSLSIENITTDDE